MPYKNPEDRRRYQREWARARRASRTRCRTLIEMNPALRVETAQDAVRVLADAIEEVRAITDTDPSVIMAKARTLSSVILVLLKAIETGNLEKRLDELEQLVSGRRDYEPA